MPADYAISRQVGTVSETLQLFAGNITTGVGVANIIASSVGFAWCRDDQAVASTGTCTTGTLGTYSVSSFVQSLSTGLLGWYNFCVPNGCFSSGRSCAIRLTTSAIQINIAVELTKTDNQTYFSSQTLSSNQLVNVNLVLGSTPVTTAAGVLATAWDLGRTANLTSTVALTGLSVNYVTTAGNANATQILGSTPVTTAAGVLATAWDLGRTANLTSTLALTGFSINTVTTASNTTWDLGRTANLTSSIALTGTTLSTNQFVNVNRILGSTPVTTAAGTFSVGITGTQTYNITGSLSGSVGSVTGSIASVTGLNPALLDVSVSSRLALASYTAPDNTGIAAVSSKTAQLTFSVAGQVDGNAKSVNGTALTGDGSGTPWGPA